MKVVSDALLSAMESPAHEYVYLRNMDGVVG